MAWEDYLPVMSPMRSGDGGAPVFMPDYDPHMQNTARMRDYLDYMQERRAAEDARNAASRWAEPTEPVYRGAGAMQPTTDPGEYGVLEHIGNTIREHYNRQAEMSGRLADSLRSWFERGGQGAMIEPDVKDWAGNTAMNFALGAVGKIPKSEQVMKEAAKARTLRSQASNFVETSDVPQYLIPSRRRAAAQYLEQRQPFEDALSGLESGSWGAGVQPGQEALAQRIEAIKAKQAANPYTKSQPERGTDAWFEKGYQVSQDPEFANIAQQHARAKFEGRAQTAAEEHMRDYYGKNYRDIIDQEHPLDMSNPPQLAGGWLSELLSGGPKHSLNLSAIDSSVPWEKIANAIPDKAWEFIANHPIVAAAGGLGAGTHALQQIMPYLSMGAANKDVGANLIGALTSKNAWKVQPPEFDADGNIKPAKPQPPEVSLLSLLREYL